MKMNLGKPLSRSDMKLVVGGQTSTCTWTYASGQVVTTSCDSSWTSCQIMADNHCYGSNSCAGVDCRPAPQP